MILRSQRIKGRATDEMFQAPRDQCFLWEKEAPVGADFGLINFQGLLQYKNLFNTLMERKNKINTTLLFNINLVHCLFLGTACHLRLFFFFLNRRLTSVTFNMYIICPLVKISIYRAGILTNR